MKNKLLKKYRHTVRNNRLGLLSSAVIYFFGGFVNEKIVPYIGYRIDWIFYIIAFVVLMYFTCLQLKCPSCFDIIDARMATRIEYCPNCGVKINDKSYYE